MHTYRKSPSLHKYGVTRGWLPQRAGLPSLNSAGTAAAVPPAMLYGIISYKILTYWKELREELLLWFTAWGTKGTKKDLKPWTYSLYSLSDIAEQN